MTITSVQFGLLFYILFGIIWWEIWLSYGNVGFFITVIGLILFAWGTGYYFWEDYPIDCPLEETEVIE
jgi:hypothetical protein